MSGDGRRLARTVSASVLIHVALVLVPGSWWAALAPREGPDRAVGLAEGPVTVSLVAWPAPAPEGPPRPAPVEPTPPSPETMPAPAPAAKPAPPASPAPSERSPAATTPAGEGSAGASGKPAGSPEGPAGGGGAGDEQSYRPPKLLAGALPLSPEESEGLPSPLEISVRIRVDRHGRVAEIVPRDPDLPAPLREALERSARAMRFAPARLEGRPVEGWFEMSFIYRR
jgi:hypothetical protein